MCRRTPTNRPTSCAQPSVGDALRAGADEVEATKQAADWPLEPDLHVPDEVTAYFAERKTAKQGERRELDAALATWREANADRAAAWDAARAGAMPAAPLAPLE